MNREEAHKLVNTIFNNLESAQYSVSNIGDIVSSGAAKVGETIFDLTKRKDKSPKSVNRYSVFLSNDENTNSISTVEVKTDNGKYVLYSDYEYLYYLFKRTSENLDSAEEELNNTYTLMERLKQELSSYKKKFGELNSGN